MSGGLRKRKATFVTIPSATIRDKGLSFRARGVLGFLLDLPDGWDVRSEWIAEQVEGVTLPGKKNPTGEGREAVRVALQELRERGYYRLERQRLRDGTLAMGTALSATPVPEWIEHNAQYDGGAVTVIQQPDGSFKVRLKDGREVDDGFDQDEQPLTQALDVVEPPAGPILTGDQNPVSGGSASPGPENPASGEPVSGGLGPFSSTDTQDREVPPSRGPQATTTGTALAATAAAAAGVDDLPDEDTDEAPDLFLVQVPTDDEPTFEDWWEVYPKRVVRDGKVLAGRGKANARKAYATAIKKISPHELMARTVEFRDDPHRPGGSADPRGIAGLQYLPDAERWLKGERWNDGAGIPGAFGDARPQGRQYRDEDAYGTRTSTPANVEHGDRYVSTRRRGSGWD